MGPVAMTSGLLGVTIGGWELARDVSEWIEILAIAEIVVSVLLSCGAGLRHVFQGTRDEALASFKGTMARGLLIGLDLLIAADIIRTVTLEATLENVAALGLLVIVRTFLAWTLVLETENRWPWQRPSS